MEDHYIVKEKEALEMLVSLGLPEPIAKDCIASRNAKELEIVMKFLDRYGHYINN